jgi:two-component system, OmpR family, response regulator
MYGIFKSQNHKMKALIIDDEVDICFLLTEILKSKQILSLCATSLLEAKSAIKQEQPSIIFLDNNLPDGLGLDFIGYIKKTDPTAKILMITAHDTNTYKNRALTEGAADYITKPFTKERICSAIEEFIKI